MAKTAPPTEKGTSQIKAISRFQICLPPITVPKITVRRIILIAFLIVLGYGVYNWEKVYSYLEHTYYSLNQPKEPTHHQSVVETFTFTSKVLDNKTREVHVYIPEEYYKFPKQSFPTLYLLHGAPGTNKDWLINGHLQHTLDEMIDAKQIRPFLVIFPDGNGPVVEDSQYVNATKVHQDMADHIAVELVDLIDHKYRTIPNRSARGIGGDSSGAYGAVNLTFHYSDRFSVVLSISGYFKSREWVLRKLFGNDQAAISDNNPLEEVKQTLLPTQTYFFLEIGKKEDKDWVDQHIQMRDALTAQQVFAVVDLQEGLHGWWEWQKNIIPALQFFDQHVQYSLPSPTPSGTSLPKVQKKIP